MDGTAVADGINVSVGICGELVSVGVWDMGVGKHDVSPTANPRNNIPIAYIDFIIFLLFKKKSRFVGTQLLITDFYRWRLLFFRFLFLGVVLYF